MLLAFTAGACKNDDSSGTEASEEEQETAAISFKVLRSLCALPTGETNEDGDAIGMEELPSNWQRLTFTADEGYVLDDEQPTVRSVAVNGLDDAREWASALTGETFSDENLTQTIDGVGSLTFTEISIDYLLSELTAENVAEILLGKQIDVDRSRENERHPYLAIAPTVLESDTHADILWFWSGHGVNRRGDSTLGQFAWEGKGTQGFTTELMEETLASMSGQKRFRKMLVIAESCYSASVLHVAEGIEGVLALTSANGSETSLADIYSVELKVWLSNRFTHNLTDMVASNDSVNYADLYKYLVQHTIGSHVQLFNADHFDNLYQTCPSEFFL